METQEKLAATMEEYLKNGILSLVLQKNLCIDRYKLIESYYCDTTKNLGEALPLTLAYEIAREGTNAELKEKVLSGKIKTLKEYKQALLDSIRNDTLVMTK